MSELVKVDWMSIGILKDVEKDVFVDYFFISGAYAPDPRNLKRQIIVGQKRGLFRVNKADLSLVLLLPMEGDEDSKRYFRASHKVLKTFSETQKFPDKTQFACG